MKQSTINFSSLTKDLILATATKEHNCSQEELYFALNCLLRSFHSALQETTLHLEIKIQSIYKTNFAAHIKLLQVKLFILFIIHKGDCLHTFKQPPFILIHIYYSITFTFTDLRPSYSHYHLIQLKHQYDFL